MDLAFKSIGALFAVVSYHAYIGQNIGSKSYNII